MKKLLAAILCITMILTAATCGGYSAAVREEEPAAADTPDVPQVRIVTDDGVGLTLAKDDGYVDATVTITDTDGSVIEGAAEVKIRGNSTAKLAKKSYTVKFTTKRDVLGMGKAKKWALAANAVDCTQLRNYIAFDTARELELEYTSQMQFCEVWMDGSYRGSYLLTEPVQEGKTRVDIDIESNGGKKDFLIECEYNHVDDGVVYFKSNGIRFACKEPDEPNDEQLAYIQSTMDDIFRALKTGSRSQIEEKVDIDSFAKYYLLNEFVKDVDVDYSSVFFYYKDGKLYAGPVWDYDLAMGNEDKNAAANYARANATDGLYCNDRHFFKLLCKCDWFIDEVHRVFLAHSDYLANIGAQGGLIDTVYQANADLIGRNFSKAGWRFTYYANLNRKPDASYQENLAYFKSWCSDRAAWLQEYFSDGYLLGDSDGDGEIDILDATAIQRHLVNLATSAFEEAAADIDGDGLTILDATKIQRWLVALSVDEPISQWRKRS